MDLYYIESGYLTPDAGYYTYVADAASTTDASFSISCDATKLTAPKEASADLTVTASQSTNATRLIEVSSSIDGAFTSTLIAIAYKNHTAALDTTSTMTIDAVANKSANVLLEHIADLNAMAAKTAVVDSALTITSTQTTNPTKSIVVSADLSTTATISADGSNVQYLEATILTTNVSIFAKPYKRYDRPWLVETTSGNISIDSSNKKFGAGSLTSASTGYVKYYAADVLNANEILIDFWCYPTATGGIQNIFLYGLDSSTNFIKIDSDGAGGYRVLVNGWASRTFLIGSLNTWHHYAIAIDILMNRLSIFVDGTRVDNHIFSGLSVTYPSGRKKALVYARNNTGIDEFRIRTSSGGLLQTSGFWSGATTATVPTQEARNDDYTVFLAHYNTDFTDDTTFVRVASATLTSSVSLSSQVAGNTKSASASLSSTVSQSTTANKIVIGSSTLSTTASQSTSALRYRTDSSTQSAAFDQSSVVGVIKQFASTENVGFSSSMTAVAILRPTVYLESAFSQTTSAVKTAKTSSTQSSASSLSSSINYSAFGSSTQSATFSESSTAVRFRSTSADVSATFASSVTANKIPPFSSTQTATFALSADVTKFKRTSASLSAAFTVPDIKAHHQANGIASLAQSFFLQDATGTRVRFADSAQSTAVNQSTTAVKTARIVESISAAVTQSTSAVKTVDVSANEMVGFTSAIDADLTARPLVYLENQFSLSTVIGVIKEYEPNSLSGARSGANGYPRIQLSGLPTLGFDIYSPGFTSSIWAKRETVGNYLQTIWTPQITGQTSFTGLVIDNDNVRLRSTYDPDEPGATWNNQAPTDTDWHHYVLQCHRPRYFRLWIDGVYKGEQTYFATVQSGKFENNSWIRFGQGVPQTIYDESWPSGSENTDVSVAQVWMGIWPTEYTLDPYGDYFKVKNDFNINNFYDGGYVNLGSTGQGNFNQLPQPYIYNSLSDPWTNVQFWNGGPSALTPVAASSSLDLPSLFVYTSLTATPQARILSTGTLQSQISLTARISYSIFEDAGLSSTTTMIADADTRIGVISNQSTNTTQTTSAVKTASGQGTLSTSATLSARAGYEKELIADLTSTSLLEVYFDVVPPTRAEAQLASEFTFYVDSTTYTDAIALIQSSGTLSADATVIPPVRVTANLQTSSTLTVTIGSIEQFAALVQSSGTMIVSAVKTASARSTQTAEFTKNFNAVKYTGIVANWTAFNSVLTAGDVINIDPYYQLKIEPETRTIFVLPESRGIIVEQETRVNII